jgi:hypothetical protein
MDKTDERNEILNFWECQLRLLHVQKVLVHKEKFQVVQNTNCIKTYVYGYIHILNVY